MIKDIEHLLEENKELLQENEVLYKMLTEAREVIDAIKKGNIDAIIIAENESSKVLVETPGDEAYRLFIENMSEGVVTLDPDGMILFSNSSFAGIVDLPLQKVVGKMFRSFVPPEYIEPFELFFNEFPLNTSTMEMCILNSRGEQVHYIVSLNRLQLHEHVVLNLVCTNVTSQKNAEAELVQLNAILSKAVEDRRRSEDNLIKLNNRLNENIKVLEDTNVELENFAHVASHDLQEPLRKIITYSNMLIRDYYQIIDSHGQTFINGMESASKRMKVLISDILNYSVLSQKDFELKPTNLQTIVEEVLSNLEITIKETKATFYIPDELPVLDVNAGQMRQLFQNLISNSLKFKTADTAPRIDITYEFINGKDIEQIGESRLNEHFCAIKVRDNGIGFSPEYSNRIFTLFQRLNNSADYPGTGIGLAICKKIVDQHKGFITASSTPDEGAVFTIMLPRNQPGNDGLQ